MPAGQPYVLHVVGADTPSARLERLRALCARRDLGWHDVVQFGAGRHDWLRPRPSQRITVPLGVSWLGQPRLRDLLPGASASIVHCWSVKALSWVLADRGRTPVLLELEPPLDARRLMRGIAPPLRRFVVRSGRVRVVCCSECQRLELREAGLSGDACLLIRDAVDQAALEAADPQTGRSALGLDADDTAVLVLPPVVRETGAFWAAWAAMLLQQVRPRARLVLPNESREARRVARLVASCRRTWMLRLAGKNLPLAQLLAAADLAVYLPARDAPLSAVVWAMAAGRPIVAADVPAVREMLADGLTAWLCRPKSPKDACRRMLQALEDPQQARRRVEAAAAQASAAGDRRRMIEEYRGAYAGLLAGHRLADRRETFALFR